MSEQLQELIEKIEEINGEQVGLVLDALNDWLELQDDTAKTAIVMCARDKLQEAKNLIEGLCSVAEKFKPHWGKGAIPPTD